MNIAALDWIMGAYALMGLISGFRRGFVTELASLLSWFFAYLGAKYLALNVADYLPLKETSEGFRYAAGFVTTFVIAMFVFMVAANALKKTLSHLGADGADHSLGALLGLLKNCIIMMAIALLLSWTPIVSATWWSESVLAKVALSTLAVLKPFLPMLIAEKIGS